MRRVPASWFALSGDTAAKGEPISGKHAVPLRDLWGMQQEAMQPLLKFTGVPYQDNETTGTVLNEGGRQLERDVTAALRVGRRTIPQLDAELAAIVTDLQTRNARSATELRLVMLTGLLIAIVLGVLVGNAAARAPAPGRLAARGAPADRGHLAHRQGRLVLAG